MPYGTDSFTDRYGDFKQPTTIDYDKHPIVVGSISEKDKEEILENHKKDIEEALKQILEINPFFAGKRYQEFTYAKNDKLAWNLSKIKEFENNSEWIFNLKRYILKAQKIFNANKNL